MMSGQGLRGAVLVELALLLPLLLLLTLATVEFAQALADYKVIVNQVRSATRYLSTQAAGTSHTEAECLLTHGVISSTPSIRPVQLSGRSGGRTQAFMICSARRWAAARAGWRLWAAR